jgi:hypothetical protein
MELQLQYKRFTICNDSAPLRCSQRLLAFIQRIEVKSFPIVINRNIMT